MGGSWHSYGVTGTSFLQWCARVQLATQSVAWEGGASRGGRAGAPYKEQTSQQTGRKEEGVGASEGCDGGNVN